MLNQEILRPISDNSSPCHGQMPGRSNESQKAGVTKSSNGKPAVGANLNDCASQNGHSIEPHVSSSDKHEDVEETMKNLNDKLSAALSTIRAKKDLVEQHAKITEEAVAGNFCSLVNIFVNEVIFSLLASLLRSKFHM
jgi:hypothetical protein